ncbi:PfkB family carbohydrate kinase [Pseudothermotoga sp. U03pept]|uniref:PfkB family carbohydrate kinase n=1 Tax=Pseudothermotoga sp. U03pept TaxID=3447012 RepID=UPI003F0E0C68
MIFIKVAVVGGTFWDVYIYGEQPHSSEILEMCGGSGLNVAYGLKKKGFDVQFFSNIGTDYRAELILQHLEKLEFSTEGIRRIPDRTGYHIAYNERPIAVDRGVNRVEIQIDEEQLAQFDYLFVNTEVPPKSIYKLLELFKDKMVFLDIGPLANLDSEKLNRNNLLIIGNEREAQKINCHVVKLGPKGARWEELFVDGDGVEYLYRTGCGDVFDVVLISHLLRSKTRVEALRMAVNEAQRLAKSVKGAFSKMEKLGDEL